MFNFLNKNKSGKLNSQILHVMNCEYKFLVKVSMKISIFCKVKFDLFLDYVRSDKCIDFTLMIFKLIFLHIYIFRIKE